MANIFIESSPVTGGGRVSSPKFRETLAYAENFEGLPEGVTRFDLLKLVKRAGREIGFTNRMVQLLEYYLLFTQEADWRAGQRPVVYQSLYRTALDFGVGERQIQKVEQALFEVGAITWNDSGNYKRYGIRDEQSGEIVYAFGVDLSPLACLREVLEKKLHEKRLRDAAWLEQKRQISWYRGQIRAFLAEGAGKALPLDAFAARYDVIAVPVRTHMSLDVLSCLCREHRELYEALLSRLKSLCTVQIEKKGRSQKSSSTDALKGVHIYSTNQPLSDKSDTSRHTANSLQKGVVSCSENKQQGREDGQDVEVGAPSPSLGHDLGKVTWKMMLGASSPRFRERIPLPDRPLSWDDLIEAAHSLLSELGIHKSAWREACDVLGRSGAAICVMIIDQKTQLPGQKIRNPGGYLRVMSARAKKGELNLQGSVFGLLKRGEGQCDA